MNVMQGTRTWVNGEETESVSVFDRGLQYGDGLFETMCMRHGVIEYWKEHLLRLMQGCQRLGIRLNESLLNEQAAIVKSEIGTGRVKLIVTRGESQSGYKADSRQVATIIWMCSAPYECPSEYYSEGVDLYICSTQVSSNVATVGIKHLNRLENILARREWQDEYHEGIMCDDQANIIEGTMSNIFFIKNETLITPDLVKCGVEGIMRQKLMKIASKDNIETEICDVPLRDLKLFDAALVTNSVIKAWPVKTIGTHSYSISPLAEHLISRIRGKSS